jgi:hypothetical protein
VAKNPVEIIAASLASLLGVEALLAEASPRLRADPGWNEVDKAVKRAIAAARAVTEYAQVRPDKFSPGRE